MSLSEIEVTGPGCATMTVDNVESLPDVIMILTPVDVPTTTVNCTKLIDKLSPALAVS